MEDTMQAFAAGRFTLTVEVVPPAGPDPESLLAALASLTDLPIRAFSVATNPIGKPRMSALALSVLSQQRTGRPAILHCTTRDHNRLSAQGLLWGARGLGIGTVLVATGDFATQDDRARPPSARDLDVFGLVRMAREADMRTGVVFDPHPESNGFERELGRLECKAQAGAQFAVTQPVFDEAAATALAVATQGLGLPTLLGVLPLRSARHAEFLHSRVGGIAVPAQVRDRMRRADEPVGEGVANAREMLAFARAGFAGACLMPPFGHYDVLFDILRQ